MPDYSVVDYLLDSFVIAGAVSAVLAIGAPIVQYLRGQIL